MSHLKSYEWINEHIHDKNVRIVDCRFQLNSKDSGEKAYRIDHLPNAIYLNLEKDLSGEIGLHGGRHPLPDVDVISNKLSSVGIDETVTVIAYDDQNGSMASRLWWILSYLGHKNVYVMNGSFSDWKYKGFSVDSIIPTFDRKLFKPTIQTTMLADVKEVREGLHNPNLLVIDSREEKRYKGIEEPIDHIAGHIPGAKHLFWLDNFNEDGSWKTQEKQEVRFQHLPKEATVIVYCGSGVSACPNVLALSESGFKNVKLYAGSWSDWISYEENAIAKE